MIKIPEGLQRLVVKALRIAGFSPGSVLFVGSDGNISQDNANLFWDNVNKRLDIGNLTKIESGSLVADVSYIVFKDGSAIKARNGLTGQIEFSGTNVATVIQQAINALPNGGRIFIKSDEYSAPTLTTVTVDRTGIAIEGEVGREGSPILHNVSFRITHGWCRIANLRLVDDIQSAGSRAIHINQDASPFGHIQRVAIENLEISKFDFGIVNDNVYKAVFSLYIRNIRSECRSGDLWLFYTIPTVEYFMADHTQFAQTLNDFAIKIYGTGPLGGGGYLKFVEVLQGKGGIHIRDILQVRADVLQADMCTSDGIVIENCNESTFRMIRSALNGGFGLGIGSCEKTSFIGAHINHNNSHGVVMGTAPGSPFGCKRVSIEGFQVFNNSAGGLIVFSTSPTNFSTDIFVDNCIFIDNGTGSGWANIHAYDPSKIVVGQVICRGGSNIPLGENVTVVGQVISDVGLAKNSGVATFNGTGAQTTFTIPHGLIKAPRSWRVEAGSADARGNKHVTADATNLYVTFDTPPPAGTNNVVLVWQAEI